MNERTFSEKQEEEKDNDDVCHSRSNSHGNGQYGANMQGGVGNTDEMSPSIITEEKCVLAGTALLLLFESATSRPSARAQSRRRNTNANCIISLDNFHQTTRIHL
jgi:hypothetical protein